MKKNAVRCSAEIKQKTFYALNVKLAFSVRVEQHVIRRPDVDFHHRANCTRLVAKYCEVRGVVCCLQLL